MIHLPRQKNLNILLLACLVDEDGGDEEGESEYRFLVDGTHIKYLYTAPGTFQGAEDDRTFGPNLLGVHLPEFPVGGWNVAHAEWDAAAGKAIFTKTEKVDLDGVQNTWHPVKLNELDFTQLDRVRQKVHKSTHPAFGDGSLPVLIKFAVWPYEIPFIEVETAIYKRLSESGSLICPKFLGHLYEGNGDGSRIIGFVTEWVEDARPAGPADLDRCKKALEELHQLGIKFGDTNKYNFLVRDQSQDALLIDFEFAEQNCSQQELDEEMAGVQSSLEDKSFRGGVKPVYLADD